MCMSCVSFNGCYIMPLISQDKKKFSLSIFPVCLCTPLQTLLSDAPLLKILTVKARQRARPLVNTQCVL